MQTIWTQVPIAHSVASWVEAAAPFALRAAVLVARAAKLPTAFFALLCQVANKARAQSPAAYFASGKEKRAALGVQGTHGPPVFAAEIFVEVKDSRTDPASGSRRGSGKGDEVAP